MARLAASVATVVVLAVLAAGCSKPSDSLDRAATERSVGASVAQVVGPPVKETTCTGDLPTRHGATFTCDVELGNRAGTLRVDVRNADDAGSLVVAPTAAVMSAAQVADQLKTLLTGQLGRSFQVDCGKEGQRVRPPDSTVDCIARDRSSRRHVQATVTDAKGTLTFEIGAAAD